ncbi:MAG: hypothetical protein M3010_01900, partial [Candidatus Dormibacteraeota bacterium]|nr:hypothetical protein [Candidatus Dormibacteraeota bacterium]
LPAAAASADLDCVVEFCSGVAQWNGEESHQELMSRARLWLEAEKRSLKPGAAVALPITRDRRPAKTEPGPRSGLG